MCWSAEVSLQTFVLGCIGLAILYALSYSNFKIVIILSFISVQLWEYFIWKYIDRPDISRIFSFIIYVTILSQPIIAILATNYKYLIKYYIFLMIVNFLIFASFSDPKFDFRPKVANDGHLDWNWFDNDTLGITGSLIYLAFFLGIMLITKNYSAFVFASILYIYSVYNYSKNKTTSSMWCWFANVCIILCIIDALYIKVSAHKF